MTPLKDKAIPRIWGSGIRQVFHIDCKIACDRGFWHSTMEDATTLRRSRRREFCRVLIMKELFKVAVFAILVLALSPFIGFWLVALLGALVFLLPVGAVVSALFPETRHHLEDLVFAKFSRLSAS